MTIGRHRGIWITPKGHDAISPSEAWQAMIAADQRKLRGEGSVKESKEARKRFCAALDRCSR